MGIAQTVVGMIRFVVEVEFGVGPVEGAGVDDDAAQARAVTANPLGQRVDDDIGPMFDRPQHTGRGEGRIDGERQAVAMGDIGHRPDVGHVQGRVAERLTVEQTGTVIDGPGEVFRVGGIDQMHFDPQLRQDRVELGVGAAVEVVGGHYLVALTADIDDRVEDGRGARGQRQGGGTAFQRSDALFQHRLGGVTEAGVDIAELSQCKEIGGMFGALEEIGAGSVDRHGPGKTVLIDCVSGMQGKGLKFHSISFSSAGSRMAQLVFSFCSSFLICSTNSRTWVPSVILASGLSCSSSSQLAMAPAGSFISKSRTIPLFIRDGSCLASISLALSKDSTAFVLSPVLRYMTPRSVRRLASPGWSASDRL